MLKNFDVADRLGYLDIPDGLLVSLNQTKEMSDDSDRVSCELVPRETRAALSQMAMQSYKGLMVEEGDTVVLSAPHSFQATRRVISPHDRLHLQTRRKASLKKSAGWFT